MYASERPYSEIDTACNLEPWRLTSMEREWPAADRRLHRHGLVSKSIYHACPHNYVFICKDLLLRSIRRTRQRFDERLIILDVFPLTG